MNAYVSTSECVYVYFESSSPPIQHTLGPCAMERAPLLCVYSFIVQYTAHIRRSTTLTTLHMHDSHQKRQRLTVVLLHGLDSFIAVVYVACIKYIRALTIPPHRESCKFDGYHRGACRPTPNKLNSNSDTVQMLASLHHIAYVSLAL